MFYIYGLLNKCYLFSESWWSELKAGTNGWWWSQWVDTSILFNNIIVVTTLLTQGASHHVLLDRPALVERILTDWVIQRASKDWQTIYQPVGWQGCSSHQSEECKFLRLVSWRSSFSLDLLKYDSNCFKKLCSSSGFVNDTKLRIDTISQEKHTHWVLQKLEFFVWINLKLFWISDLLKGMTT